jgi:hypothetical protein
MDKLDYTFFVPYPSVHFSPSVSKMSDQSAVPVERTGPKYADMRTEHEDSTNDDPKPGVKEREARGIRWLAICVALYASCILYGLDTTITADVAGFRH